MGRCVIIGGAEIRNYETVRPYLRQDDFFIFCDSGLYHLKKLMVRPDLIIGDFDSHPKPDLPVETIVLPREKDDTDTGYAAREAVKRGFSDFLLLGVIGGRLDHTLGNVSLLLWLEEQGKTAVAVDDYSQMKIISRQKAYVTEDTAYFSLLNITGEAKGLSITGAKYPLNGAELRCEDQYGVSNEVLPGETAAVTLEKGRLLLIEIRR